MGTILGQKYLLSCEEVGGVAHNLLALLPQPVTGLVSSMGFIDFYLYGPLKMYPINKQFVTDTNTKQTVTSWVECVMIRSVWYCTRKCISEDLKNVEVLYMVCEWTSDFAV